MPATQTITAFYSFTPNTTIYSAEVNNNFSLMRGHLYPIDASVAAFATNTYDLGSTSASWRNTYTRDLILGASGTISLNSSSITTFTMPQTSGRLALANAPTIQRFTSGSGTYTTPAGVSYIIVEAVGGGGGGGHGGNGSSTGASGTASTFGTSAISAGGGSGGGNATSANYGGAGGAVSTAAPATVIFEFGGGGGKAAQAQAIASGGNGGASYFGGEGRGGFLTGLSGNANTGGGGGGGGTNSTANAGFGGGAGGYVMALIANPSATFSFVVGQGGAGVTTATSTGYAGASGGSGLIVVYEYK